MPKLMTEKEVETQMTTARATDTFEYGTPDDEDYFTATLYQTNDRRHFRHIDSAGMTADKTADTGEWLTEDEVKKWKKF